jgi:hypothetical protein
MTLLLERLATSEPTAPVHCDGCHVPELLSPLAGRGDLLLCAACARRTRLNACGLFIAQAVKPEGCEAERFQRHIDGLRRNLEVLEAHTDAAWWLAHVADGAQSLLTFGAAEVVALQDEYDAATFAEDEHGHATWGETAEVGR